MQKEYCIFKKYNRKQQNKFQTFSHDTFFLSVIFIISLENEFSYFATV